ncbi:MAG: carbohydrate binding family 9 domain-containing protein [candidate division Zixibacteria bacterium]|nr:carbohydrate binding family 9 domain-containing protein [candidate division Zixibacteria bacterium]
MASLLRISRSHNYCLGLAMMCLLIAASAIADNDFTPVYHPSLHVTKTTQAIHVDGDLGDPGWQGAAMADNFAEHDPGDQVKPPVDTRAFMTYDDDHLYVAFVCYDDPAETRTSLCERDRMYGDDNICFCLDTYGDAAWAYTMNVNACGVQADAIWSNGFGEDGRYDLIWESAGKVTDSGYQVEIAIPFSSLRFPNQEVQEWKVDFWRHHWRETHYTMSWAAYDRDEPCWPCQWGTITGIENVKPGRGIEILPAMVGYQAGELFSEGDLGSPLDFQNDDAKGELAISAKYSITSNITTEATYNPDFSQVEADADQIDVNSTTALSFPEKRPFFQEGSDLFRTLMGAVYTRSINDPDFAAKATARINKTSIAYLVAHDENSPMVIPFEEGSTSSFGVGKSISNFFRARQTFGDNSQVGLLVTDRRIEGGGAGSLYSLDGSFRLNKNFRLRGQIAASHTEEPDDSELTADLEINDYKSGSAVSLNDYYFDDDLTGGFDGQSFWGYGYLGLLDYDARDVWARAQYSELGPRFRTDNGNERVNNRRQASVMAGYTIRPSDNGLIESIRPDFFVARIWNTEGKIKDEWVFLNMSAQLRKARTNIHAQYMRSGENYAGVQFDDIWSTHICVSTQPSELISFGGNVSYGHRIARGAVVMGKEISLGGWLDLKPLDRIFVENWFSYIQSRDLETDAMLFKGFTARSKLSVQFTREISLRFVAQYNDFSETWDFDPLLTYRLNPFTMFYVGMTNDYEKLYGLNKEGTAYVGQYRWPYDKTCLTARQFFVKLQYLFQL